MPLEHVVIAYLREVSWLNVLMLESADILQPYTTLLPQEKLIEVSPFGFRWIEENVEQHITLGGMFELNSKAEDNSITGQAEECGIQVTFGCSLKRINQYAVNQNTIDVELGNLPFRIEENVLLTLNCSQCAHEIVGTRSFNSVMPFPILTLRPESYFGSSKQMPLCLREDHLYYGLNYIVVSPKVLEARAILYYRSARVCSVACGRCRQLLGEVLGEGMAIHLYADALRLSPFLSHQLHGLFDPISNSQIMLRLLSDATSPKDNKTSIFLKCIRPDGQLHYLLMVAISPVHLFRSKICLTDDFEQPVDPADNSTDGSCDGSQDTDQDSPAKRQRLTPVKLSTSVDLIGYRGNRIKYIFLSTDEEMSNSSSNIQQWLSQGSLIVRISYGMLMELVNELNANEQWVASLEKRPIPQKSLDVPRLSYILYKYDEDF